MPTTPQKLSTCLWFDTQAEEAANFYLSVFKSGKINAVSRYGKAGRDVHGKKPDRSWSSSSKLKGARSLR